MFSDLTEHQKNVVAQELSQSDYLDSHAKMQRLCDGLSDEDIWLYFLRRETDPEEVNKVYQTLFGIPKLRKECRDAICMNNDEGLLTLRALISTYGHHHDTYLSDIMTIFHASSVTQEQMLANLKEFCKCQL